MTNQENNVQAINPAELEDLTIQETDASEVKGGPIFMNYEGIKGSVQAANAPMPQTREHILLARQVG